MRKSPPTWLSLSRLSPRADPVLDRLSAPETLLDAVATRAQQAFDGKSGIQVASFTASWHPLT